MTELDALLSKKRKPLPESKAHNFEEAKWDSTKTDDKSPSEINAQQAADGPGPVSRAVSAVGKAAAGTGKALVGEGSQFARHFVAPQVVDYPVATGRFFYKMIESGLKGEGLKEAELFQESLRNVRQDIKMIDELSPAKGWVGAASAYLPTLYGVGRLAVKGAINAPRAGAAVYKAAKNLPNTIMGIPAAAKAVGAEASVLGRYIVSKANQFRIPQRATEAAVQGAGKIGKIGKESEKVHQFGRAKKIVNAIKEYKNFRNLEYGRGLDEILKTQGNTVIPTESLGDLANNIDEILGMGDEIAPKFREFLEGVSERILGSRQSRYGGAPEGMTFSELNSIKQTIGKEFGAWGKKLGFGQANINQVNAARTLQHSLKEAINAHVPDVADLNDGYHAATNFLTDMTTVMGAEGQTGTMSSRVIGGLERLMKDYKMEDYAKVLDTWGDDIVNILKKEKNLPKEMRLALEQGATALEDFNHFLGTKIYEAAKPTLPGAISPFGTGSFRSGAHSLKDYLFSGLPLNLAMGAERIAKTPIGKFGRAGLLTAIPKGIEVNSGFPSMGSTPNLGGLYEAVRRNK